jgi:hypothetical protein
MHKWLSGALTQEKNARMLAEERRLARLAPRKSFWSALRTRVARGMFGFAVALEREETWRAVWEKLEAPRR